MRTIFLVLTGILIVSCSEKATVKVIGNGHLEQNKGNTIIIGAGNGYIEEEMHVNANDALKAEISGETQTAAVNGKGFYVWNLKSDTLIGSRQKIGESATTPSQLSAEAFKQIIDSLEQLLHHKNINAANQNYFIEPGKLQKLTESDDVFFVGPYNRLPAQLNENVVTKKTEVFKFYTASDIREQIARLQKMM